LNFIPVGQKNEKTGFVIYKKPFDMKVKIINNQMDFKKMADDKSIYLKNAEFKFDNEDLCFLENYSFKKYRRIVKITNYYEENQLKKSKSIFRKVIYGNNENNSENIKKNEIGLQRKDLILLNVKHLENANIKISSNVFHFLLFYILNSKHSICNCIK